MSGFKASFQVILDDAKFAAGVKRMQAQLAAIDKAFSRLNLGLGKEFMNLKSYSGSMMAGFDKLGGSFNKLGGSVQKTGDSFRNMKVTSLLSFRELTRGWSDFTKSAEAESGRLISALARIPMFLDSFNMKPEFIKDLENGERLLLKSNAMHYINRRMKEFVNQNPMRNLSVSDAAYSYGTFLSGNLDMSAAEAGLSTLSYALKVFPEIDRTEMTNFLVNSYNQMKTYYRKNNLEIVPEMIMPKILNTMSMTSNKYKFDLASGETPFKAVAKTLTTNPMAANYELEEIMALAGTLTSAGVSAAEADTAINNFFLRIGRASQQMGISFTKLDSQGKRVHMNLVETLDAISRSGNADAAKLMSAFTIRGSKALTNSIPQIKELAAQIREFKRENENMKFSPSGELLGARFIKSANIMNSTFESSKIALDTTTNIFSINYGRIARGATWMAMDVSTSFLSMINNMSLSSNTFAKLVGSTLTYTAGALGAFTSLLSTSAPTIMALATVIGNRRDILSVFKSSFKLLGSPFGALIKGAFILSKALLNPSKTFFILLTSVKLFSKLGLALMFGFTKGAIKAFLVLGSSLIGVTKVMTLALILPFKTLLVLFSKSFWIKAGVGILKVFSMLGAGLMSFMGILRAAFSFTAISGFFKSIFSFLPKLVGFVSPIGLGIAAVIGAIGIGLVWLEKRFGTVTAVIDWFKNSLVKAWEWLKNFLGLDALMKGISDFVGAAYEGVTGYIADGISKDIDEQVKIIEEKQKKAKEDLEKLEKELKGSGRGRDTLALGYYGVAAHPDESGLVKVGSGVSSSGSLERKQHRSSDIEINPATFGSVDAIRALKITVDTIRGYVKSIDDNLKKVVDIHNNRDLLDKSLLLGVTEDEFLLKE